MKVKIEWNRRNILIALAVLAGAILIFSGMTEVLSLALFGGVGWNLRRLTRQRKRMDDAVGEIKRTIESAKEYSGKVDEEVKMAYEKISGMDLDDLIDAANERERRRGNTTIR